MRLPLHQQPQWHADPRAQNSLSSRVRQQSRTVMVMRSDTRLQVVVTQELFQQASWQLLNCSKHDRLTHDYSVARSRGIVLRNTVAYE